MKYLDQIKEPKLVVIDENNVIISWYNTEDGRDKLESWTRTRENSIIFYSNNYNKGVYVFKGSNDFYKDLETIYKNLLSGDIKTNLGDSQMVIKKANELIEQYETMFYGKFPSPKRKAIMCSLIVCNEIFAELKTIYGDNGILTQSYKFWELVRDELVSKL